MGFSVVIFRKVHFSIIFCRSTPSLSVMKGIFLSPWVFVTFASGISIWINASRYLSSRSVFVNFSFVSSYRGQASKRKGFVFEYALECYLQISLFFCIPLFSVLAENQFCQICYLESITKLYLFIFVYVV